MTGRRTSGGRVVDPPVARAGGRGEGDPRGRSAGREARPGPAAAAPGPTGGPVRIKRVYDSPAPEDGRRALVDGLWPRGLTREAVAVDEWMREIAPSADLRRWFGHDPARWAEFQARYRRELAAREPLLARLVAMAREGPLTLVYGARDPAHNNAVVLRAVLEERLAAAGDRAPEAGTARPARSGRSAGTRRRPHARRPSGPPHAPRAPDRPAAPRRVAPPGAPAGRAR